MPIPVTSADGILTAVVDTTHAGVLLRARYTGTSPPSEVRFWRTTGGERTVVRSGDPAPAIAGEAHAYDHEPRPGTLHAYTAEANGVVSKPAVVQDGWTAPGGWLKSAAAPDPPLRVLLAKPLTLSRPSSSGLTTVSGARNPHATVGRRKGVRASMEIIVRSVSDRDRLRDLLDTGVLLYQEHPTLSDLQLHLLPEDVTESRRGLGADTVYDFTVPFVEVGRPPTRGARLLLPGRSWSQMTAPFTSLAALRAAYPTVWDLLLAAINYVPPAAPPPSTVTVVGAIEVDNGDGTVTVSPDSDTTVVDNGDGTFTTSGADVIDNGDGTFTA